MVGSMTWPFAKVSISEAADQDPCPSVCPLHLLLSGPRNGWRRPHCGRWSEPLPRSAVSQLGPPHCVTKWLRTWSVPPHPPKTLLEACQCLAGPC